MVSFRINRKQGSRFQSVPVLTKLCVHSFMLINFIYFYVLGSDFTCLFIFLLVLKHFLFLDLKLTAVFSDTNYTGSQKNFSYLYRCLKILKNLKSNLKDFKNREMKKTISQLNEVFITGCGY